MLDKLKCVCSIRKIQLLTTSSSVSQKSHDRLTDPLIQLVACSNNWDQQLQKLSNPIGILFCGQAHQGLFEPRISMPKGQKLLKS